MGNNHKNSAYPRPLTSREREWIEWILPPNRPGYNDYLGHIKSLQVIGQGRRGKGEVILARGAMEITFDEPLPPVFAYGAIETNFGTISITLREIVHDQVSMEIVSHRLEEVPREFEESRRWTYSTWSPGDPCPQCQQRVREVSMHASTAGHEHFILAICPTDKRLWVYDASSKVNRLIPVTNFYNELMLHKNLRDPKVALDANRLFTELPGYFDSDLAYSFFTYNKLKTKVHVEGFIDADKKQKPTVAEKLRKAFSKRFT